MNAVAARGSLERECIVFTRYLTGQRPDQYVVDRYVEAHALRPGLAAGPATAFDRLLAGLAARHPLAARLADAFAGVFDRRSLLREKLVVLLAILETSPTTAACVEVPDAAGVAPALLVIAARTGVWVACLAASAAILLPLKWVLPRRPAESSPA